MEKRARACVCENILVSLHAIWRIMRTVLLAIGVLVAAMLLLCVGVIFRKDHSFRSQHIHQNKRMKEDGIHCSTAQDKEMRRQNAKKLRVDEL